MSEMRNSVGIGFGFGDSEFWVWKTVWKSEGWVGFC